MAVGVIRALKEMTSRDGVTPMIDIPPLGWDHENQEAAKSVDEHVRSIASKIEKNWGTNPLFLDFYMLPENGTMDDGVHPLAFMFDTLRGLSGMFSDAVPVTGLRRPKAYQAAVKRTVARDNRGVCLRLEGDDAGDTDDLNAELTKLLGALKVTPADTDIVYDLKEVLPSAVTTTAIGVRETLNSLPMLDEWRSLTLAASSFPLLLDVQSDDYSVLPRAEWPLWRGLIEGKKKLKRLPAFGDYGIRNPHYRKRRSTPS